MIDPTPKQRLFVDHYLQSFNATDAARKAGYKGNDKTLGVMGSENLKKPCIISLLSKRFNQVAAKHELRIVDVREEFTKNLDFVSKLRVASEKWLVDPDDADKFTIDPRADEIDVVYWTLIDDIPTQRRERLDALLAKLNEGHIAASPTPFVKAIDLREYALKVIDRIDTTLDKFAKMGGDYTKDKVNPADAQSTTDAIAAAWVELGFYDEATAKEKAVEWVNNKPETVSHANN